MREMYGRGLTYGQIAHALGRSKNSCVGRGHRLHLPPRPHIIKQIAKMDVKENAVEPCKPCKPKPPPKACKPKPPPPKPVVRRRCQYIAGDPVLVYEEDDSHFCEEEAVPGWSWCAAHLARVYRSPEDKEEPEEHAA